MAGKRNSIPIGNPPIRDDANGQAGQSNLVQENVDAYGHNVVSELLNAPDLKREEFRLYLEQSDVMEYLGRFLISLYDEPEAVLLEREDLIPHFYAYLSTIVPAKAAVDKLVVELDRLHRRFNKLEQENQRIRERLRMHEPPVPLEEEEEEAEGEASEETLEN